MVVIFTALLVEEKEKSLESGVSVSKATFKALVSSSGSLFVSKQNIYKVKFTDRIDIVNLIIRLRTTLNRSTVEPR